LVVKQLHTFRPQPAVIKRRIEHLIDQDYLERDEKDATLYHYVA
jgi:Cullin protein neddylation domain